jgi:hypothetical protein
MKEITIVLGRKENVILIDDDSSDLFSYSQELSKTFMMTNTFIIETTSGCFVGKPGSILSFVIKDLESKEEKKVTIEDKEVQSTTIEGGELVGVITDE